MEAKAERKAWTPEEDEKLRACWGKMPQARVARRVGRTGHACRRRAKHLGLKAGRQQKFADITKDVRDRAAELHMAGVPCEIVAAALGLSPYQIGRIVVDRKLPRPEPHPLLSSNGKIGQKWEDGERQGFNKARVFNRIRVCLQMGLTDGEAASASRCCKMTVVKQRAQLGIPANVPKSKTTLPFIQAQILRFDKAWANIRTIVTPAEGEPAPCVVVDGGRPWTEEDDQFLRDNWGVMSREELAEKLDRTTEAVKGRRGTLKARFRWDRPRCQDREAS